jgi:glycosyltransferase involved in cell wall biosynthesis
MLLKANLHLCAMPMLSVVMPCLNEAKTIGACVHRALGALQACPGIDTWEVVVADNGSTDGSQQIAAQAGAQVVHVDQKGYGSALHSGIMATNGDWILFADADESYDFGEIDLFAARLQTGAEMVIGNRFKGHIEKGAMPFLHRYLGTPVISAIGRRSFGVRLGDFNCGMRAIVKQVYLRLGMKAPGMEYASEMIARAGMLGLRIDEVPISLHKDKRGRKPHLRTWSDGWKHLRLLLLLNPKWLLLAPAIIFLFTGFVFGSLLAFSYIQVFSLVLDIHTLYYASIFLIIGIQLLQFYVLARLFGSNMGLYPARRFSEVVYRLFAFEKSLLAGSAILLTGIGLSLYAVWQWQKAGFGSLDPVSVFRIIIPAGFCLAVGMQVVVFGFLLYTFKHMQTSPLS